MDSGKTVTVSNSDDLLARFAGKFANEEVAGFSWRVIALPLGVEIRLEGRGEKLILPVRARLHPSRQWLKEAGEGRRAVLLAPHIPEALAADLRRLAINHADLNGRLFLTTGWALIDRRPTERSHRSPETALDVFSQKTSRLVRCLLAHREREWTQEELTGRTGLSRGLVSRALTYLTQEEFVRREAKATREVPARYRVQAFDRLLDAWQQADRWHARTELHEFSVLTGDPAELAADVRELLRGKDGQVAGVFTQWFAARLRHPYTDSPVVSAYVRQLPESLPQFARPVASGGNLWLLVPKDEGVFQETQEVAGYPLVSDVQIYLDLLQVEGRGPEQAKALRNWEGFAR
jgi:DNA-binding HxlR family transcriptional regulator